MKEWFNNVIRWFNDVFHIANVRAALDAAITELEILRKAVNDFDEQREQLEARVAKYKKQIKELKAKLKEQESEETTEE